MRNTKHGIARTGLCRTRDQHLVAANDPHELNLDAAQRELDRRAAEGEDVSQLWVNTSTYAIERRPDRVGLSLEFIPASFGDDARALAAQFAGGPGKPHTCPHGRGFNCAICWPLDRALALKDRR